MKYKILTAALLVFLSFTLSACTIQDLPVVGKFLGGVFKKPVGKVTLTMWGMWENPEVMSALIQKYQEKHPNVTINYDDRSVMKADDYKERVFSRINEEGGPDIIRVHNTWVSKLKASLAAMPSKTMNAKAYAETFYPAAFTSSVFDNNIYAIPLYYDGLVLVYNKAHFKEAGQEFAPTGWEEFRTLAVDKLRKEDDKGNLVRAGAAIGTADNITFFPDILGVLFSQTKVSVPSDLESQAAQDALTFYTNMSREDRIWNNSFPEASAAFTQDKVSMIFVPTWQLLDIIKARPDMELGVAPLPQALPQDPAAGASFWMEVVPSKSKNKDAAWDFLKFLTEEEQQLTMFSEASKFRTFGEAYSTVALKDQLSANPYLKPLLDMAPIAKPSELSARVGNSVQVNAMRDAVNEVLSGRSAKDALKTAKDKMTKGQ